MTPLTVRTSNRAQVDIAETIDRIASSSPGAAMRFLDALDATGDQLATQPMSGKSYPHPRFAGLRFRLVIGFPKHVVFYQPRSDHVLIVRVLRSDRDLPTVLGN